MTMVSVLSIVLYKLVEMMRTRQVIPRIRAMRARGVGADPEEEEEDEHSERGSTAGRRGATSRAPSTARSSGAEAATSGMTTGSTTTARESSTARRVEPTARGSTSASSGARQLGALPKFRPNTKGASKGKQKGRMIPRAVHEPEPEDREAADPEPDADDDYIPLEPSIFFTPCGERYHVRHDCYGLRNAMRQTEALPCPRCCTPDYRRLLPSTRGTLYIKQPGIYHVVSLCADPNREGLHCLTTCRCCFEGRVTW